MILYEKSVPLSSGSILCYTKKFVPQMNAVYWSAALIGKASFQRFSEEICSQLFHRAGPAALLSSWRVGFMQNLLFHRSPYHCCDFISMFSYFKNVFSSPAFCVKRPHKEEWGLISNYRGNHKISCPQRTSNKEINLKRKKTTQEKNRRKDNQNTCFLCL